MERLRNNKIHYLLLAAITIGGYYLFTKLMFWGLYKIVPKYITITSENVNKYLISTDLSVSILLLIILVVLYRKINKKSKSLDIELEKRKFSLASMDLFSSVVYGLGLAGVSYLIMNVLSKSEMNYEAPGFLQAFTFTVIFAPLIEEFLFRGIVYKFLEKFKAGTFAIILSSLVFAVYHADILQGIFTFVMGIVLAVTYRKTNNLVYPIIIHMVNNLLVTIVNLKALEGIAHLINYFTVLMILPLLFILFKDIKSTRQFISAKSNLE